MNGKFEAIIVGTLVNTPVLRHSTIGTHQHLVVRVNERRFDHDLQEFKPVVNDYDVYIRDELANSLNLRLNKGQKVYCECNLDVMKARVPGTRYVTRKNVFNATVFQMLGRPPIQKPANAQALAATG